MGASSLFVCGFDAAAAALALGLLFFYMKRIFLFVKGVWIFVALYLSHHYCSKSLDHLLRGLIHLSCQVVKTRTSHGTGPGQAWILRLLPAPFLRVETEPPIESTQPRKTSASHGFLIRIAVPSLFPVRSFVRSLPS